MKQAVQVAAPPAPARALAIEAPVAEPPAEALPEHRLSNFTPFPGTAREGRPEPPEESGRRRPAAATGEEARASPVPVPGGAPRPANAPPGGDTARAAPATLLVEDDTKPDSGQMRKSAFLRELHEAVSVAADEELSRAGRTSDGCPVIQRLLSHYSNESAAEVERALRLYAPEASGAVTARAAVALVAARAGAAASRWVATRDLSGVPPELLTEAARGRLGGLGSLLSLAGGFAGMTLLAKTADGSPPRAVDPDVVRSRLGPGRPLESATRAPFERAFGYDFSSVRIHAGAAPARVAGEVGARAFTVGNDVAFGAGEYRPGTLAGDALVAHELAHVVQQRGADVAPARADAPALESDADSAAVAAVAALHDPGGRFARFTRTAMPRLRSGLRLQRCAATPATPTTLPPAAAPATPATGPTTPGATPGAGVAAGTNPCGGGSLADAVQPFDDPAVAEPTLQDTPAEGGRTLREFGATDRDYAEATYAACQVQNEWRFKLASLVVPVKIAVRPVSYLTHVVNENDPAVTQATHAAVRRDLLPNATQPYTHSVGLDSFSETVTNNSRRNQYWNRPIVLRHEEFHRSDWMGYYRRHLKTAEEGVWASSLPLAEAADAQAAVRNKIATFNTLIFGAYRAASLEYVPQKETRAYNYGAAEYQALADAVQARAQREWPAVPPGGAPP